MLQALYGGVLGRACQNTKQKVKIKPLYLEVLQNKKLLGANMGK